MERIVVLGCGGTASSTFSRELARLLDAPLTHLDAVYDAEWHPLPTEEFEAR